MAPAFFKLSPSRHLRRLLLAMMIFSILPAAHATADDRPLRIIFLGDSLTAGLGLDVEEAYPNLIQKKLSAAGMKAKVVNAGVSGDTSAGGLRRIEWLLREPADVLVIALGANDGLRGLDVDSMKKNLRSMIDLARAHCKDMTVVLAGMLVPPNQGADYARRYGEAFSEVARDANVPLLPFLLEGVAGNPELNQPDGVHPNVRGQEIIAEHVWEMLRDVLEKRKTARAKCDVQQKAS